MSGYTPTTERMKQAWCVYQAPTLERKGWYPSREAIKAETDVEFDRWFVEVKAQALEEAAEDFNDANFTHYPDGTDGHYLQQHQRRAVQSRLRALAQQLKEQQ